MKTRQVTERIGEYLGPVDWGYDFLSHYGCCFPENRRAINCEKAKDRLRLLAENPDRYMATSDGGWPRVGWGDVLQVGMYDGWPYWRPVPSVCISGTLGAEWHSFNSVTDIMEKEGGAQ